MVFMLRRLTGPQRRACARKTNADSELITRVENWTELLPFEGVYNIEQPAAADLMAVHAVKLRVVSELDAGGEGLVDVQDVVAAGKV